MSNVARRAFVFSFVLAGLTAGTHSALAQCNSAEPVTVRTVQHEPQPQHPSRSAQNTPGLASLLLQTDPSTTTLVSLLAKTGLLDTLGQDNAITIFAPSDEAFAALPAGTLESLAKPENAAMLRRILANHVVSGRLSARQVVGASELTSAAGQSLAVSSNGSSPTIGGAQILRTDLRARNVTVHVIGGVLVPPSSTLVQAAIQDPQFSTLVAAVQAAGLAETLQGTGPFTVLAPTNEAFAKLGQAKIAELLEPQNRPTLQAILKYHVIPGRITATQALTARRADTAEGSPVTFRLTGGRITVNNANVLATDIQTSNGIIHSIDTVLLP